MVEPSLKEDFKVRSFDLDVSSRMKISSLLGFFQEVAGRHAELLGVGYDRLIKERMAWMLSRIYIRFGDFTVGDEKLRFETWPMGTERLFYRREFTVISNNKVVISASSFWLLINLDRMRPCIIPINEDVIRHNNGRYALNDKIEEIPSPSGEHFNELNVTYSMIDRNGHVNNTRYADWIMDEIGFEESSLSVPRYFCIEYRNQVTPEDKVLLRHSSGADNNYLVDGLIKKSGKVCFRARVDF